MRCTSWSAHYAQGHISGSCLHIGVLWPATQAMNGTEHAFWVALAQFVCGGSITQESTMGGAPGSPRMGEFLSLNEGEGGFH
jgi:hypothetical protein